MTSKRRCCVYVVAGGTLSILCVNVFFFSSWRAQSQIPAVESDKSGPVLFSAKNNVHIHKVCIQQGLTDKQSPHFTYSLIFAKEYKLAYIPVPKIGSTFIRQMFHVLNFGVGQSHKIMDWSRIEIHANTGNLVKQLNRTEINRALTIIPARNPFSRLFAAYVDKVFLPFSVSLGKSVMFDKYMLRSNIQFNKTNHYVLKNVLACTVNVSFQDFIEYALSDTSTKKAMFDHYGPVSVLYSDVICNSARTVLVKQETFADDIERVLKTVNVSEESFNAITKLLHSGRVVFTVRSIIKALYRTVQTQRDIKERPDCWTWPVIVRRMWKAFQIQGLISKHVAFPYYKFSEKEYHDQTYLIDVALKTIERNPLSLVQSMEQRREALIKDYKQISESAINSIREVYRLDFEMFNYSTDLYKN